MGQFDPPLGDNFITKVVERGEGNLLHAVKLRDYLLDQAPEKRRVELIPRGLAGFMEQIWQQFFQLPKDLRTNVRQGLGVLCAAREALPLSVLEGLLAWPEHDAREDFLRATRPFLLDEPAHWEGVVAYRPYHESFREFVAGKLEPDTMRGHHRLLADSLAAWPGLDEPGSFRHRYALRHALTHRLEAHDFEGARNLCTDIGFLEEKCRALGTPALEADLDSAAKHLPADNGKEDVAAVGRAVRTQSHWLRKDQAAMPGILHNYLRSAGWTPDKLRRTCAWSGAIPAPRLIHPVALAAQEVRTLMRTSWAHRIAGMRTSPTRSSFGIS